jgi:2-hydroxycyclohexanecarboxyl-CoA dehydrogenase
MTPSELTPTIHVRGKAAFVTGGGQGIGRAICLTLAREGADVAVADINAETAAEVAGEVEKLGRRGLALAADVTDLEQVTAAANQAIEKLGKLDILVNNAAIFHLIGYFWEIPIDYWSQTIDICLYGVFNCTRAVLPHMIEREGGRIISMASDAGKAGDPRSAVYSAAKAGIMGFTRALAREVGRYKITVNAVAPASTETPSFLNLTTPDLRERMIKRSYPLGRLGQPQDLANAVLFLASDAAEWITGQSYSVNGGFFMA